MSLWNWIDDRLEPARMRFISAGILVVALTLLILSFATAEGGITRFGPPLGADFAGFYAAASILNLPSPDDSGRLYDVELQDRIYHELLPKLADEKKLPYVHPPFVALAFRPLASLPYEWAFALWLVISAGMYLTGLVIVRRVILPSPEFDWTTAFLLCLAFQPFVMECWLGGQLSALGFLCYAMVVGLLHVEKRFLAGVALGFLLYKPTLLVLFVPMFVIGRRIRTLAGLACSGLVLALVSLIGAGSHNTREFVGVLTNFAQAAAGQGASHLELPLTKYVDLNSFSQLLLGGSSEFRWPLVGVLALIALIPLARVWLPSADSSRRPQAIWAATLVATLVINMYVGIYDTILVCLAALLFVASGPNPCSGYRLTPARRTLFVALFIVPWITQPIARASHIQIYTVALYLFAHFLIVASRSRVRSDAHFTQTIDRAPHAHPALEDVCHSS
jgi:hypothetical protein